MEGIWAREKLSDPFRLPAFGEDGLRLAGIETEGLFKDIEFQIPELVRLDVLELDHGREQEILSLPDLALEPLPPLEPLLGFPDDSLDVLNQPIQHDEENQVASAPEDIWQLAKDLPAIKDEVKYLTWRNFHNPSHREHQPVYLSEAGAVAFDAALHAQAERNGHRATVGRALQNDVLLKSLWHLGIGRSSVLFRFDTDKNTFEQAITDGRASGTTLKCSQSVIDDLLRLGNATVRIRQFVDKTYLSTSARPSTVALAKAVATVQDAVEAHCVDNGANVGSLLQLQALFEHSSILTSMMQDLVEVAIATHTDEMLISAIYERAQQSEVNGSLRGVMTKLLQQVSRPWLDYLQESIGMSNSLSTSKRASLRIQGEENDDLSFTGNLATDQVNVFPDFVQKEERAKLSEVNRALLFLQDNEPDHSLLQPTVQREVNLEWAFDWKDLERIQHKAEAYQQGLVDALDEHKVKAQTLTAQSGIFSSLPASSMSTTKEASSWLAFEDPEELFASINALDAFPQQSPNSSISSADDLRQDVVTLLSQSTDKKQDPLQPPLSVSFHLSIMPLLDIQYRELTSAVLRSLLYRHKLRMHFDTMHSFQFCTSGTFTTRLAAALFDPEAELAERRKHVVRSGGANMGLKLGSDQRREWPPASSELRLALMGILEDSWHGSLHANPSSDMKTSATNSQTQPADITQSFSHSRSTILPGDLNFALRADLPPSDIDRILDADSIYALDFLKLNYTPPQALQAMFTPNTLDIYDRVFRLLLRLLRVNFVMGQVFRETVMAKRGSRAKTAIYRIRHRANHFVQTITAHFMYAGIGKAWSKFNKYLDELHEVLTMDSGKSLTGSTFSFEGLIRQHQSTLSNIAGSLLLRSRQRRAATALEIVLSDILNFANNLKNGSYSPDTQLRNSTFEQHVEDFIDACIGTSQKKAHSAGHAENEDAEQNVLELVELLRQTP